MDKFLKKEMQQRGHAVKTSNYNLKGIVHFGCDAIESVDIFKSNSIIFYYFGRHVGLIGIVLDQVPE